MTKPNLHLIEPKPETVAQKVRRLQGDAQKLAQGHVRDLLAGMASLEALAREIAEGGSAYHHGSQELASRVAQSLASQRLSLAQIVERL
jgi:hypothetical protein